MTEQDVLEYLRKLPKKKQIQILASATVNEDTTYKDLFILKKEFDNTITSIVHSHQAESLKPRFDNAMMFDALSFQLENKASPTEVFQHVQDLYNMDPDWLKVAKHTPMKETDRKLIAKEISNIGFPTVQEISEKGLSVKDAIVNGKSPTRQIKTVSNYISLSDRVDVLEADMKEVKLKQAITECRLEIIENQISNPQKLVAIRMREEGKTQKEISELLDVNIRTIKRWLKKD